MQQEIIDLIHARMDACLALAKNEEDLAAYCVAESRCLALAAEHGWDWEADDELVRFCSKATTEECCIATRVAFDKFLLETVNGQNPWLMGLAAALQRNLPPQWGYVLLAAPYNGKEDNALCATNVSKEEQLALVQSWQKSQT